MGRDFFQILPSELSTDILSRLPLRSVAISKCVCKSWLNLLDSDYFEIKTPPAALVRLDFVGPNSSRCKIFEIEDEADVESHDLHYLPLTDFEAPLGREPMRCIDANGLLLLYPFRDDLENPVYICNPLTREFIVLSRPEKYASLEFRLSFDFCVSKISGQYKVVCINRSNSDHHVYTLGTGIWRRIETGVASGFTFSYPVGNATCNGNLHWAVDKPCFQICGFDVETECFSIISPPSALALLQDRVKDLYLRFTVFRDCLCFCYTRDFEIVIWLMKEYGVEESWTIEYKFSTIGSDIFDDFWDGVCVYPIRVFKDGDVSMMWNGRDFIYYSNKTRTIKEVGMFDDEDDHDCTFAMIFTPSLFSLKSFELENVISF